MTREQKAMYLMRYAVSVIFQAEELTREDKQMQKFVRSIDAGYLKIKIVKAKTKN